jgi:hypothetical protein
MLNFIYGSVEIYLRNDQRKIKRLGIRSSSAHTRLDDDILTEEQVAAHHLTSGSLVQALLCSALLFSALGYRRGRKPPEDW